MKPIYAAIISFILGSLLISVAWNDISELRIHAFLFLIFVSILFWLSFDLKNKCDAEEKKDVTQ